MDKVGAALFHAFGAAKNGGLPAAPTSDGDWSLLVDAFISRNSSKLKKPTGPLPQSRIAEILCKIRALRQNFAIGIAQNAGGEEIVADRIHLGRIHRPDGAALAA